MGEKINVPNVAIIAYFVVVVGACLLATLLPVFLECEKSNSRDVILNPTYESLVQQEPKQKVNPSNIVKKMQKILAPNSQEWIDTTTLSKDEINKLHEKYEKMPEKLRSVMQKLNVPIHEKKYSTEYLLQVEKFKASVKDVARNSPFMQKVLDSHPHMVRDFNTCPEIITPPDVGFFPWYNTRLPKNIRPITYYPEFFIPSLTSNMYQGAVYVDVNVASDNTDNYILLNTKLGSVPYSVEVLDKNNQVVEVDCAGEFVWNEYFVIKTKSPVLASQGPLSINIGFLAMLDTYESGVFSFKYGFGNSTMLLTRFEPTNARKAFPCWDEPEFKASYNITIDHPVGTTALSNMPSVSDQPFPGLNNTLRTNFALSPSLPSYFVGFGIFYNTDMSSVSRTSANGRTLKLWARKEYVDDGFATEPINMLTSIFNQMEIMFSNFTAALPQQINIIASPLYASDGTAHFGLPIFQENFILYKRETVSESKKQQIALLFAKQFLELIFGNYVTMSYWDELWLQEGVADYLKYRIVHNVDPTWKVLDQFITEELVSALIDDGYPSSHPVVKPIEDPYELYEYYDSVERSKSAAILRMIEGEQGFNTLFSSISSYISNSVQQNNGVGTSQSFFNSFGNIRTWSAADFAERWFQQANYPLVYANLFVNSTDGKQYLEVIQDRAMNTPFSIFAGDILYPSKWNFTWYVPLTCLFDHDTRPAKTLTFNLDKKTDKFLVDTGAEMYTSVHCDKDFAGYYLMDYSVANWEQLGQYVKTHAANYNEKDRAQIIHNLFLNAYSERTDYHQVVDVLSYLIREKNYLPWKTAARHLHDMVAILEYRKSFLPVSTFFNNMMREIENSMDLWVVDGDHTTQLLKEVIIDLACRLQDGDCLQNATALWPQAYLGFEDETHVNDLPPHVRAVVYNYHFQNTYNVNDYITALSKYNFNNDLQEQHRLLESLTYSRLPWLLADFFEASNGVHFIDFFDVVRMLSSNPLGREIMWDTVRINYMDYLDLFGLEEHRLGQMIIDITASFENEFVFFELVKFIYSTPSAASGHSRFKSLEIVSTNVVWLQDKEEEIENAFSDPRSKTLLAKHKNESKSFQVKANEFLIKEYGSNWLSLFHKKLTKKQQ